MSKSAKLLIVFANLILTFALTAKVAGAASQPAFPSCLGPQLPIRVDYQNGTHGVPGSSGEHKGKDTVYNMLDGNTLQCFCAEDGFAVQTNWWKVTELSEEEIEVLRHQGWIYVPNGSLWGLDEAPYLAYNNNYSCKGVSTSTNTGGVVLAASGFAPTGTLPLLALFGITALGCLLFGVMLRKHVK